MAPRPAILLLLGLCGAGAAAGQELPACPETVAVREAVEEPAPEGWSLAQRPPERRLVDIRFHNGPPPAGETIEPVAGSGSGNVFGLRYMLRGRPGPVWMSCSYTETSFMLARELPGDLPAHVRVNYDRQRRAVYLSYF